MNRLIVVAEKKLWTARVQERGSWKVDELESR